MFHVPENILADDCSLPESVKIGPYTYDLEWYEVKHGSRGLVMYGSRWSGSVAAYPGELWTNVRTRAVEAAALAKSEYGGR